MMSRTQRKKRELESPVKKRRRERRKEKRLEAHQVEEKQMAEHLTANGWQNVGHLKDTWKIGGWERSEDCYTTLRKACKIQAKLNRDL